MFTLPKCETCPQSGHVGIYIYTYTVFDTLHNKRSLYLMISVQYNPSSLSTKSTFSTILAHRIVVIALDHSPALFRGILLLFCPMPPPMPQLLHQPGLHIRKLLCHIPCLIGILFKVIEFFPLIEEVDQLPVPIQHRAASRISPPGVIIFSICIVPENGVAAVHLPSHDLR